MSSSVPRTLSLGSAYEDIVAWLRVRVKHVNDVQAEVDELLKQREERSESGQWTQEDKDNLRKVQSKRNAAKRALPGYLKQVYEKGLGDVFQGHADYKSLETQELISSLLNESPDGSERPGRKPLPRINQKDSEEKQRIVTNSTFSMFSFTLFRLRLQILAVDTAETRPDSMWHYVSTKDRFDRMKREEPARTRIEELLITEQYSIAGACDMTADDFKVVEDAFKPVPWSRFLNLRSSIKPKGSNKRKKGETEFMRDEIMASQEYLQASKDLDMYCEEIKQHSSYPTLMGVVEKWSAKGGFKFPMV